MVLPFRPDFLVFFSFAVLYFAILILSLGRSLKMFQYSLRWSANVAFIVLSSVFAALRVVCFASVCLFFGIAVLSPDTNEGSRIFFLLYQAPAQMFDSLLLLFTVLIIKMFLEILHGTAPISVEHVDGQNNVQLLLNSDKIFEAQEPGSATASNRESQYSLTLEDNDLGEKILKGFVSVCYAAAAIIQGMMVIIPFVLLFFGIISDTVVMFILGASSTFLLIVNGCWLGYIFYHLRGRIFSSSAKSRHRRILGVYWFWYICRIAFVALSMGLLLPLDAKSFSYDRTPFRLVAVILILIAGELAPLFLSLDWAVFGTIVDSDDIYHFALSARRENERDCDDEEIFPSNRRLGADTALVPIVRALRFFHWQMRVKRNDNYLNLEHGGVNAFVFPIEHLPLKNIYFRTLFDGAITPSPASRTLGLGMVVKGHFVNALDFSSVFTWQPENLEFLQLFGLFDPLRCTIRMIPANRLSQYIEDEIVQDTNLLRNLMLPGVLPPIATAKISSNKKQIWVVYPEMHSSITLHEWIHNPRKRSLYANGATCDDTLSLSLLSEALDRESLYSYQRDSTTPLLSTQKVVSRPDGESRWNFYSSSLKLPSVSSLKGKQASPSVGYSYVDGEPTLAGRIKILKSIASTFMAIHSKGLSHGHLTAHNILLGRNEKGEDVSFVLDLGFHTLKRFSAILGTYSFKSATSSPEILSGECRFANHANDVYSFGVLMWECLSGIEPFRGLQITELKKIVSERNLRPSITANIRKSHAEIVRACWQTDPNLRPTFSTIVDALSNA